MPLTVACPECQTPLEVDDQYRTWKVRCPQCRHEFKPDEVISRGEEEYTLVQVEEDDEDYEPRPRRRRRRRRRYFDDNYGDPYEGRREIQTPASVLEWFGWISVALILIVCFILVVAGLAQPNQPRNRNNDDPPEMFIFLGICLAVGGVPYFGIIAYGARRLRSLSSHGWGLASAIMAIAALPLFGVCGFPIFGPGIWALVVMNNENVKAAFRQRERRRSRYDDDDEDEYD